MKMNTNIVCIHTHTHNREEEEEEAENGTMFRRYLPAIILSMCIHIKTTTEKKISKA